MKYVSKKVIDSAEETTKFLKNLSDLELHLMCVWSKGSFPYVYEDWSKITLADQSKFVEATIKERKDRNLPVLSNLTEIDLFYKLNKEQ